MAKGIYTATAIGMMFVGPVIAEIPDKGCLRLPQWGATVRRAGNVAVVHYTPLVHDTAGKSLPPTIVGIGDAVGCYYVVCKKGILGLAMTKLCANSSRAFGPQAANSTIVLADEVLACHRLSMQHDFDVNTLLDILAMTDVQKEAVFEFKETPVNPSEIGSVYPRLSSNTRIKIDYVFDQGLLVGKTDMRIFVPPLHTLTERKVRISSGTVSAMKPGRLTVNGDARLCAPLKDKQTFSIVVTENLAAARDRLQPRQIVCAPPSVLNADPKEACKSLFDFGMYMRVKSGIKRERRELIEPFVGFKVKRPTKLKKWNAKQQELAAKCDLVQIKYDGFKIFLHVRDGEVRLFSKLGLDFTEHEINNFAVMPGFKKQNHKLYAQLPNCVLDGEYIRTEKFVNGLPVRTRHNASSDTGAGYYVVYDLAYLIENGVNVAGSQGYMQRLETIRTLIEPFPSLMNAVTFRLQGDKVAEIERLLDVYCRDEMQEGLILKRDTKQGYMGLMRRAQTYYAVKPSYVWPEPIRVQYMGKYLMSKKHLNSQGNRQSARFVFGVPDRRSPWHGDHPWAGYVPVFAYTTFGSSGTGLSAEVRTRCNSTPQVDVVPEMRRSGPAHHVTSMAHPTREATIYEFTPESFLKLEEGKLQAWYPMTAFPHIPQSGVVSKSLELSTVDNMNESAVR